MMIGPEAYYEFNLKGKTEKEILTAIRGLKQEMGHLKNVMENPKYPERPHICPSESTRLKCTRDYLNRAIAALEDLGTTYHLSKAEEKAKRFDENINNISGVKFEIGGFFEGYTSHTVTIDSNLHYDVEHSLILKPSNLGDAEIPWTKEEFLDGLKDLHIGEWRTHYDTRRFGYEVLDGTQWSLEITLSSGKKYSYDGSNVYPHNFDELKELFLVDDYEDDDDYEED